MSRTSRSLIKLLLGLSAALATPCQVAQAAWPRPSTHETGADKALNARVRSIVASMTLEQKIGQITQADIRSITPDDVRR